MKAVSTTTLTKKRSKLLKAVIEQFIPRFTPDVKTLFTRDSVGRSIVGDAKQLERLGIQLNKRSTLPDMILYFPKKRYLYLVEAIAANRRSLSLMKKRNDLLQMSARTVKTVYVNAFLDFNDYSRYGESTPWNTDVWIAEVPNHMIHFNGDKFLGPHHQRKL